MSTSDTLLRCAAVARTYGTGAAATVALDLTDCEVHAGDRIAIVGPSGSGKSTLLHLMAGLDEPSLGAVSWPAIGERRALRPGPVAMIFQGPSLLAPLTVLENVALPLILGGRGDRQARARAAEILSRVGLDDLLDKLPEEISGGQSQRVAVARALAGEAVLVLADEPTGQLDRDSGAAVVDLLLEATADAGTALVITTHDPTVARRLPTRWEMHAGRVHHTLTKDPSWSR